MAAALSPAVKSKSFISTKVPLPSQRLRDRVREVLLPTPAPAAKRPKVAPHEFPEYDADRSAGFSASPLTDPKDLFRVLEVAPFARITFADERKLQNFRHNLYGVNVEGKFRYATRREGWTSLIVIRLK